MREIRSSGSVEGVVSNHDPYSDWRILFIVISVSGGNDEICHGKVQCGPAEGGFAQAWVGHVLHPAGLTKKAPLKDWAA